MKLTDAQKRCLKFSEERGPTGMWPFDVCSMRTVKKCEERGWLERCGTEPGRPLGLILWRITEAGRAALR